MSPRVVQALVRRQDDAFLAECIEFPVVREAESLSAVIAALESAVRGYLSKRGEDGEFLLLISCYLGRFSIGELC